MSLVYPHDVALQQLCFYLLPPSFEECSFVSPSPFPPTAQIAKANNVPYLSAGPALPSQAPLRRFPPAAFLHQLLPHPGSFSHSLCFSASQLSVLRFCPTTFLVLMPAYFQVTQNIRILPPTSACTTLLSFYGNYFPLKSS